MSEITIIKGDRSQIYTLDISDVDTLDANWTGKVGVCQTLGGTLLVDREMPKNAGSTAFIGYLTPAETAELTANTIYYMIFQITNTTLTPPVSKEIQYKIQIVEQGIS